jgi:hypothetical protein
VRAHPRNKVVHPGGPDHIRVTISLEFQRFAWLPKIFTIVFKRLQFCPKNEQLNKLPLKQGKSRVPEMFCADLSTETVDSFALARGRDSLQPRAGIDDSAGGI